MLKKRAIEAKRQAEKVKRVDTKKINEYAGQEFDIPDEEIVETATKPVKYTDKKL